MNFLKFICSKTFWLNVLLAIVGTLLLVTILMWALTHYTSAGRTIMVPDVTHRTVQQIERQLSNMGLDYVVIDSIHKSGEMKGAIVEQIPRAGKNVKKGRKIFLTINAYTSEMVEMPHLVDLSLRNAQVVLETRGLKIGKITYKPSEYNGLVLAQLVDGESVAEKTKLEKGTRIELVVGNGGDENNVLVPELIGLTREQARIHIDDAMLKVGTEIYDSSVKSAQDSASSVVYRQNPASTDGLMAPQGSPVTIWLTKNNDIVIDALEEIENAKE